MQPVSAKGRPYLICCTPNRSLIGHIKDEWDEIRPKRRCEAIRATARYCGGCGQPLWEKCPKCSAEGAADERFCGSCGTDIIGGLDAQSQQLTDQMMSAARELQFELAARLRDEIADLKKELRGMDAAGIK